MRRYSAILLACAAVLNLSACAKSAGQNQYAAKEVGKSRLVEFGTIIQSREVGITGQSSGAGALVGAGAGAGGGAYVGNGSGNAWAIAGGALAGAAIGALAEQSLADKKGLEYTVTTEKGVTMTLVQTLEEGDRVLQPGERVMIQTSGSYQRILPTDSVPETIKRPKGLKVVD